MSSHISHPGKLYQWLVVNADLGRSGSATKADIPNSCLSHNSYTATESLQLFTSATLTWNVRQPSLEKPPLGLVAAARSANMLKPQSGSTEQKQWLVSASFKQRNLMKDAVCVHRLSNATQGGRPGSVKCLNAKFPLGEPSGALGAISTSWKLINRETTPRQCEK